MQDDVPFGWVLLPVLVLLMIGGMIYLAASYQLRTDTLTITVADKSRGSEGSGSDYLVWTTDNEVFEVDDAFWYGHFRASDVYGQLDVGGTYRVFVIGIRRPFFSEYRRIIRILPEGD